MPSKVYYFVDISSANFVNFSLIYADYVLTSSGTDVEYRGNYGVDRVYVPKGSWFDFSRHYTTMNEIYLEGYFSEYTLTAKGATSLILSSTDKAHTLITLATGDKVFFKDGSGSQVVLTLASPIPYGATAMVAYTDSSSNNVTQAIQDAAGNDLPTFAAPVVTNNTPVGPRVSNALFADAEGEPHTGSTGDAVTVVLTFSQAAMVADAPILTLGSGVSNAVSLTEATSSSGVLSVNAQSGSTVLVTFTDSATPTAHSLVKTVFGSAASAVRLATSDLGFGANQLQDGSITVTATATDTAGNVSSQGSSGFTLDTAAPALIPQANGTAALSVQGNKLTLNFSEPLDATNLPPASAFVVNYTPLGSSPRSNAVSAVAVSGKQMVLTLNSPIPYAAGVTLSYTDASATDNANNVIQDLAGNEATSFSLPVTNLSTFRPQVQDVVFSDAVGDAHYGKPGDTLTATISFNEPVAVSGTVTFAFRVANGLSFAGNYTAPAGATASQTINLTLSLPDASAGASNGNIQLTGISLGAASSIVGNFSAQNLLPGNLSSPITDTGYIVDSIAPAQPVISWGASAYGWYINRATATASTGVVTVSAESGSSVQVTLTDVANHRISKTLNATGSAQAVTLSPTDFGELTNIPRYSFDQVYVSTVATDLAGNVSNSNSTVFFVGITSTLAPWLTLATGISNGATRAEASASTGVVKVQAEAYSTVLLTFSDSATPIAHSIIKTITAQGQALAQAVPVTLTANDLGTGAGQLNDGNITITATATNIFGDVSNSSARSTSSFTLDTVAPQLLNGQVVGDQLTLRYDSGLASEVALLPLTTAFTVMVNGTANAVTGVSIADSRDLLLTLSNPVPPNATVTISYTVPAATAANGPVQDMAGNAAAALSNFSVTDSTPYRPVIAAVALTDGDTGAARYVGKQGAGGLMATVTFNEDVHVSGTATLTFGNPNGPGTFTGTIAADANSTDFSRTRTVMFTGSTLPAGDFAVYLNSVSLGSGASIGARTLANGGSGGVLDAGNFSVGSVATGYVVDNTAPAAIDYAGRIFAVDSSNSAIDSGVRDSLKVGDKLVMEIPLSEATTVTGSPAIAFTLGSDSLKTLRYDSSFPGTSATRIYATYSIAAGDLDADGIGANGGTLGNLSATMTDLAGNTRSGSFGTPLAATGNIPWLKVDTVAPTLISLTLAPPSNGRGYHVGDTLDVYALFSESVLISGLPTVAITVGSNTIVNDTIRSSYYSPVVYFRTRPLVAGDADSDGITLIANALSVGGDSFIQDAAGNNAILTSSPVVTNYLVERTSIPTAPILALGSGVENGANRAEALASTGVVTVVGESGSNVLVTFSDSAGHSLIKTVLGTGAVQQVTLAAIDLGGNAPNQLQDGSISVSAVVQDGAGNTSPVASSSFSLSANVPTLVLTLGTGVVDGATLAEATASSGVLTVRGDAGSPIVLTFSDSASPAHTIVRTLNGTGADQAVTLATIDLGTEASQLGDGVITVSASSFSSNGNSNSVATQFVLDTVVPTALSGSPTISFSADTGTVGDFITTTHAQTITVHLNSNLAATDVLWGRLDSGLAWTNLNGMVNGTTLTWTGANLLVGNHTLQLQVRDQAGNEGPVFSQAYVTGALGPSLALGAGIADGASRAEATASTGVVTVNAASGSSVALTFTDERNHTLNKTLLATGANQPVLLASSDIGTGVGQLYNGPISVSAVSTPVSGGLASEASTSSFNLYADILALGSGIADGATAQEAVQSSGVVTLFSASGARVLLIFSDSATPTAHSLVKTLFGTGAVQAITLEASDIGTGGDQLIDGNISVTAQSYDAANNLNNTGSISFTLDTVVPTALSGSPTISFSADTGTVGDFITTTHAQTITVHLNSNLAATDVLWGRLDSGLAWTNLTGMVSGTTLTWTGANLLVGNHTLQLQVRDRAGNEGPVFSQAYVTGALGPSLMLGAGVADGANRAEATASTGVVTVNADSGSSVVLTFTDERNHTLSKTLLATGANQPVLLASSDIGTGVGQLYNGPISISAVATPVTGLVSDVSTSSFNLYADMLALGSGVADGATAQEAVQSSGVVTLFAASGARVLVTFSDNFGHSLVKLLTGTGAVQAVTLVASDIGIGVGQLRDGNIRVTAQAYDAANNLNNTGSISFTLDTVVPTALSGSPTISFSADTGTVGDFITTTHAQTITVHLNSNLAATDVLWGRLDSGLAWTNLNGMVNGTTLTWTGANLLVGNHTLQLQVRDQAGNEGPVFSQAYVTGALVGPSLALGAGIADGASRAEATASTGVVTVNADSGSSVVLTFTDERNHTLNKTLLATGANQPVLLASSDIGTGVGQLYNGPISVSAVSIPVSGGLASEASTSSFNLYADMLALGSGVADGASAQEVVQSSGVVTLFAASGARVLVTFSDNFGHSLVQLLTGTGAVQAVTLVASDIGMGVSQLRDGNIRVTALAFDATSLNNTSNISFMLDTVVPTALSGSPTISFSADTGTVGDFITTTHAQTITVHLNSNLAATDVLWGRLDSGLAWTNLTGMVSGTTLTWTGANLLVGNHTLQLQVRDQAGNEGPVFSQAYVTGALGPSLMLGAGIADGANRAEATASTGVVTVNADSGSSVVLTFTDERNHTLSKTLLATGANQPVLLASSDIGTGVGQLYNGPISVSAVATPVTGLVSDVSTSSFNLYADMLALGSGVADGASAQEVVQSSGVVTLRSAPDTRVLLTFSDSATPTAHSLVKTLISTGAVQAITLVASEIGTGAGKLMDGTINVWAAAYDTANNLNNSSSVSFNLDTVAPTAGLENKTGLNLASTNHQYATLPSAAVAVSGDLTLEAWVYSRGTQGNWARIFDLGAGTQNNNVILGLYGGKIAYSVFNGSGINLGEMVSTAPFTTNTWHHVALAVSRGNYPVVDVYVDGVNVLSGTLSAAIPAATRNKAFVGHSNWANDPDFNGSIRDVRIYDTQRSDPQVINDMSYLENANDINLIGYYPLENSATSGKAGGPAATLTGGAVFSIASLALSADTGAVGDFITKTAAQTITGKLTAPLATGEKLWVSLNDGSTWIDPGATVTGTSVSIPSLTLLSGTHNLQFAVRDVAGNQGPVTMQQYTLDTTAPTAYVPRDVGLKLVSTTVAANRKYVTLPQEAASVSGTLTLEAWVFADGTLGQWARIFDLNDGTSAANNLTNNVIFGFSQNKLSFTAFSNGTYLGQVSDLSDFPTNSWHHVAVTVGSGNTPTVNLFIDDVNVRTGNLSAAIPAANRHRSFIGHSNVAADPDFNGTIRDVRIYDSTLTQAQIGLDMAGTVNTADSNLKGYYPLTSTNAAITTTPSGKPGVADAPIAGTPVITVPTLKLSNDTGYLGDFSTNTRAQTITALLKGTLAADEKVWGSVDEGSTWTDLSSFTSGNTVTWTGVTLGAVGVHTMKFEVRDLAGNAGLLLEQGYRVI